MYVKKYLFGYILLTIGVPVTLFVCNEVGNDMMKAIGSLMLVLCAIINFIYSMSIVKKVFGNRGHNKVDLEYVTQISVLVILIFLLRYSCAYLLGFEQIPSIIISALMSPFILLIASPFMKNYCLNMNTIYVSLMAAYVLIMVMLPLLFKVLDIVLPNNMFIYEATYGKFFMYEHVADTWIMNIFEFFNINISDKLMLIILNFMAFAMWSLTFLPYVVINSIITDELTYMEFCKKLTGLNIMVICITVVGFAVLCSVMAQKGEIEVLYNLKHYLG